MKIESWGPRETIVHAVPNPQPDGTFDQACRENGTLGIFCGHNHNNDASIEWNGMRYTYGSKSSTYDSYTGTMLGGTQIFLDAEESGLSVAHLKYVQLMKDTNEQ